MTRKSENTGFTCLHCYQIVHPVTNGSYRNHCPYCLYSCHLDDTPGDRQNLCRGLMRPIGLTYHSKKRWQIVHQCVRCGIKKVNKVAAYTDQADDDGALLRLQMQSWLS